MTRLALAVAIVLFASGLAFAVRQWQRRGESALFVLRLLPASLLLIAAPLLAGGWDVIRNFTRIAAEGAGGKAMVVHTLSAVLEGHFAGTLLFVLAIVVCAALQGFAEVQARDDDQAPPSDAVERWLPAAAPVLLLPVFFLWRSARATVGFVVSAIPVVDPAPGGQRLSPAEVADLSAAIAERLITDQVVGLTVTGLLVLSTVALVLFARNARASRPVAWLSWTVVGVAMAGGVTGALLILGDLQLVEGL